MKGWDVMRRETLLTCDGRVQLARLRVVASPWFGIYLHDIRLPDDDRDPHDHPWSFLSLVLRGSYDEQVHSDEVRTHTRRRWSAHRMPSTSAHRITKVDAGTLTLVLRGRRSGRGWGFWTQGGWVDHREYSKAGVTS